MFVRKDRAGHFICKNVALYRKQRKAHIRGCFLPHGICKELYNHKFFNPLTVEGVSGFHYFRCRNYAVQCVWIYAPRSHMLQVASQCLNSFIYSFIHPFILQTLSEWYSTLHQVTRLPLIPGSAKYFSEVFSVETYFQNSKCYLTILLANWHTPRTNACKLKSLALFFSFPQCLFSLQIIQPSLQLLRKWRAVLNFLLSSSYLPAPAFTFFKADSKCPFLSGFGFGSVQTFWYQESHLSSRRNFTFLFMESLLEHLSQVSA